MHEFVSSFYSDHFKTEMHHAIESIFLIKISMNLFSILILVWILISE